MGLGSARGLGAGFYFTQSNWEMADTNSFILEIEDIDLLTVVKTLHFRKSLENIYLTLSQWLNRILHNYFNGGYDDCIIIKIDTCMGH